MRDKLELSRSSWLLALPVAVACLVLGVLAAFFRQPGLAGILVFLAAMALAARAWAFASAKGISVHVSSRLRGLFPGEEAEFEIEVRNEKFLPVVWLDLFCPLAKNLCMTPREGRAPDDWEKVALGELGASTQRVGEKRFSFFLWYETIRFTSRWTAQRRGVYSMEGWRLRTGDGFGLAQIERPIPREDVRQFAVYPKLVPVSPAPFLRSVWNADAGSRGVMEDPTVIRSTRDYMTSDSLKQINWRLTARGLPLTVNVYEDILPRGIHFILDGESFFGEVRREEELEEALSILASEVVCLHQAQVRCGLSLSKGASGRAVNRFHAEDPEVLLQAMAAYEPMEPERDPETGRPVPHPAVFDEGPIYDTARRVGRFYYIAYDATGLEERGLLRRLGRARVSLLTYAEGTASGPFETICMQTLKEGGSHGR